MSENRRGNTIRECKCTACGDVLLTTPGTPCSCGGSMRPQTEGGMMRKAFGIEDTDLKKGGLR